VAGWQEGLKLLKDGGHIELVVPANLGYGDEGSGTTVPPYSILLFDIKLHYSQY